MCHQCPRCCFQYTYNSWLHGSVLHEKVSNQWPQSSTGMEILSSHVDMSHLICPGLFFTSVSLFNWVQGKKKNKTKKSQILLRSSVAVALKHSVKQVQKRAKENLYASFPFSYQPSFEFKRSQREKSLFEDSEQQKPQRCCYWRVLALFQPAEISSLKSAVAFSAVTRLLLNPSRNTSAAWKSHFANSIQGDLPGDPLTLHND